MLGHSWTLPPVFVNVYQRPRRRRRPPDPRSERGASFGSGRFGAGERLEARASNLARGVASSSHRESELGLWERDARIWLRSLCQASGGRLSSCPMTLLLAPLSGLELIPLSGEATRISQ
jgi:hypothetical protein